MHYRGKYGQCSGNRCSSTYCHNWCSPFVPNSFTGAIAGDCHYSTGTIEEPLLYMVILAGFQLFWVCTLKLSRLPKVCILFLCFSRRSGKLSSLPSSSLLRSFFHFSHYEDIAYGGGINVSLVSSRTGEDCSVKLRGLFF